MAGIAVLGEPPRVDGWALAGALVIPATGAEELRRAWAGLPADVEVVVATPAAAAVAPPAGAGSPLVVVLP